MTMLFHTAFAAGSMAHFEGPLFTVSTADARVPGRYSARITHISGTFKNITPSSEIYYRAAMRFIAGGSSISLKFRNFTTIHVSMGFNPSGGNGYITASPGGNSALGIIIENQWYLVEVHVVIHDTLGIVEVKIDGVTVISVIGTALSPIDTRSGTSTTIDNVQWGTVGVLLITDIAICDTLGAVNNTWIGNGYGSAIVPDADGDASEFTGSDADKVNNWALVDEVPWNTTDYVQSNVVGEKDLYNMTSPGLAANEYCNCITTRAIAKLDQEGDGGLSMGIKTATESWAAATPLPSDSWKTLSQLDEVDPDDGLAWDGTKLDAIQAGVKAET
jgi:hypothetical protein